MIKVKKEAKKMPRNLPQESAVHSYRGEGWEEQKIHGGEDEYEIKRQCSCGATDGWVDHFATFASAMVELCIKAGSPEKVCSKCGQGWAREIIKASDIGHPTGSRFDFHKWSGTFRPTCTCNANSSPATVLDPFAGSGVTLLTALKLGRKAIGIELNPDYARLAERRLKLARVKSILRA